MGRRHGKTCMTIRVSAPRWGRGAASGDVAGCQSDQYHRQATRPRVVGSVALTLNSKPAIRRVRAKEMTRPARTPKSASLAPSVTTRRRTSSRLSAKGHAHADFVRTLDDQICHDAVDAGSGELWIGCVRNRGVVTGASRSTIARVGSDPNGVEFLRMVVASRGIGEGVVVACLFGHAR